MLVGQCLWTLAFPLIAPSWHLPASPWAELLSNADIRDARIPVVQNYSAAAATDGATIRDNLLRQLVSPVRWSESIGTMARSGTEVFVECGPGNVLAGLARRIDRSLSVHGIGNLEGLESALEVCAGL